MRQKGSQCWAAMNAEGGGVINNQDCDILHKGALDNDYSDTGYRESASATEFLLPEMFSTVKRYVERRRDHLRSFGARFLQLITIEARRHPFAKRRDDRGGKLVIFGGRIRTRRALSTA